MMKTAPRWMMTVLMMSLLIGLAGCKGTDSRRVPTGETTRPELDDKRQLPVSLIEFREQASADILQALPTARGISDTPERVTILLGDINNKTTSMSTNDYEYVVSGVRSNLIRSQAARWSRGRRSASTARPAPRSCCRMTPPTSSTKARCN